MANKKSFLGLKFIYDAPATLSFAFVCVLLFVVDSFLLKGQLTQKILCSPTNPGGKLPFMASDPLSYLRLILYGFGAVSSSVLVSNMIFVLLLGPSMEERYGTIVIAIMMLVCVLFSGVLNACFSSTVLAGCSCVIFMMIFLNSFVSLSKKKIPLSFVVVFVLFIFREVFEMSGPVASRTVESARLGVISASEGGIKIVINIAGGLCGSLFAFLTSPKAKSTRKTSSEESGGGLLKRASAYKNKAEKTQESSGNETVVASMKFDD